MCDGEGKRNGIKGRNGGMSEEGRIEEGQEGRESGNRNNEDGSS